MGDGEIDRERKVREVWSERGQRERELQKVKGNFAESEKISLETGAEKEGRTDKTNNQTERFTIIQNEKGRTREKWAWIQRRQVKSTNLTEI